ncbi:MAG: B12-binding domain-containing radical SAM protein [Terriglobia bacterium]
MKMTLIHPPLDDPTVPYHSTAYLKGHLAANGFHDVTMRDINIEYVNWLLQPATVAAMNDEAGRRLEDIRGSGALGYEAQEKYYALLATGRSDPAAIERATKEMRTSESFVDFPRYVKNLRSLTSYLAMLGALSYPAEHDGFSQMTRGRYSMARMGDLLDPELAQQVCLPFTQFFDLALAHDPAFGETDLFGISIVYDHQLFHAFHFARLLKRRWPEKRVVFGGTAISQLFKYLKDASRISEVFTLCDAIVLGEGETAICEIAASDGDFERGKFTNTITWQAEKRELHLPTVRYENVTALGRPVYDHPWDLYLSPERGINYSPTRGCYWNRCTFCDYGLNTDKPTSPWRERKIDQVIEDLGRARKDHGVRYVYFAVDVMAPGYLERLSDGISEARLDIRWSAELRMERIFSEERARKMAQAGCVCVSFGMESGNQRILDLIDKGTKIQYMSSTMKNFTAAGIACQLMAFTDFPTETPEERQATLQFIRDNEPYWSAGGLGAFLLTGTAIIAKNPKKFGITLIETQDADVTRAVAYRVDNETGRRVGLTEDADSSFDETGGAFPPILGRPWAGGTDSLHTMIYYDRHGRNFFRVNPPRPEAPVKEVTDELAKRCEIEIDGQLVESNFDLAAILANREGFSKHVHERLAVPAEPTHQAFRQWSDTVHPLQPERESSYWLVAGKNCVRLDKLVFRVLGLAATTRITIGQIVSNVPPAIQERLFTYLKDLEIKGLILLKLDNTVIRSAASIAEEAKRRAPATRAVPEWKMETSTSTDSGLVQIGGAAGAGPHELGKAEDSGESAPNPFSAPAVPMAAVMAE